MIKNDVGILIILSSISRKAGGLLVAVSALANKLNLKLSVFGLKDEYTDFDKFYWNNIKTYSSNIIGPKSFGYSDKLKNKVLNTQFSLIHLHGLWMYPQLLALKYQKKFNCPIIISPHGMLDPWAVRNSYWKKKLVGLLFANKSLRKANCIHALCKSEYKAIRNYGLSNPVAIIPNGIDLPPFFEKKNKNKPIKNLLFVGRIHPKKGLKLLIEAFHILKSKNDSFTNRWQLQIVGWDQDRHEEELKALCNNYNLESEIKFLGPLFYDKKVEVLKNADAFILPSYSEGLPMSILEAWSYQLPVLMTRECNLPEGFDNNAAIEVSLSPNDISKKLIYLDNMSLDDYKFMSKSAIELVSQKFTWDKIAQDMENTYNWITDSKKSKPDFIKLD